MSSGVASRSCHTDSRYWVIVVSFGDGRTRPYAVSSPSPRTATPGCDSRADSFSTTAGAAGCHPVRSEAGRRLTRGGRPPPDGEDAGVRHLARHVGELAVGVLARDAQHRERLLPLEA